MLDVEKMAKEAYDERTPFMRVPKKGESMELILYGLKPLEVFVETMYGTKEARNKEEYLLFK